MEITKEQLKELWFAACKSDKAICITNQSDYDGPIPWYLGLGISVKGASVIIALEKASGYTTNMISRAYVQVNHQDHAWGCYTTKEGPHWSTVHELQTSNDLDGEEVKEMSDAFDEKRNRNALKEVPISAIFSAL